MMNDHKTQGEWKIKLTMVINFFSSKNSEEFCTMYSTRDNIEIMMGSETDKLIEERFESFSKISRKIRRISKGKQIYFWTVLVHCITDFIK